MAYKKICISSGHCMAVQGAIGVLNEVDEARRVTDRLAAILREYDVEVATYHDNVSKSQSENLNRLVDWHNACPPHDLDISVHFNAHQSTSKLMGTEVLYKTQKELACTLSAAIAEVGLPDRGGKLRNDLAFLNGTSAPAVLLEVCFVDSTADAEIYRRYFDRICENLAQALSDGEIDQAPESEFHTIGECSYFGGPGDTTGVTADEGLAFIYDVMDAPHLFLPYQPEGTSGLARRLNPYVHYVACRWNYEETPKPMLLQYTALVRAPATGIELQAFPSDWGPNANTGRVADLSPSLMMDLQIETGSEVEVTFPYKEI